MTISHWGLFPGWFVPTSNKIGCGTYWFQPIDFDTYCIAVEAAEGRARDYDAADAAEMRKAGRLH